MVSQLLFAKKDLLSFEVVKRCKGQVIKSCGTVFTYFMDEREIDRIYSLALPINTVSFCCVVKHRW